MLPADLALNTSLGSAFSQFNLPHICPFDIQTKQRGNGESKRPMRAEEEGAGHEDA